MDVLCMQFRCMQWQHDEKKGKYDPDFKEKVKAPKPEKKKLKEKKSKVEVDMAELIHLLRKAKRQKAIKDAFIENQYNFLTPDWKRNTEGAKFMEKVEYRIFGVDWIFGNTAKKTAGLWDRFCCCCTSVMSTAEKPKQSEKAIPSLEVEDGDDEKLQECLKDCALADYELTKTYTEDRDKKTQCPSSDYFESKKPSPQVVKFFKRKNPGIFNKSNEEPVIEEPANTEGEHEADDDAQGQDPANVSEAVQEQLAKVQATQVESGPIATAKELEEAHWILEKYSQRSLKAMMEKAAKAKVKKAK